MNSFHIQVSFNSLRQTISLRISNTNLLQFFLLIYLFWFIFPCKIVSTWIPCICLCEIFQIQHCLNCKDNTVDHLYIIWQKQWHNVKNVADWIPSMVNYSWFSHRQSKSNGSRQQLWLILLSIHFAFVKFWLHTLLISKFLYIILNVICQTCSWHITWSWWKCHNIFRVWTCIPKLITKTAPQLATHTLYHC